jgi:hypothetical protein
MVRQAGKSQAGKNGFLLRNLLAIFVFNRRIYTTFSTMI